MNWYLAKIIFNININDSGNSNQFDEQLRLIYAASEEAAFYKARAIGKSEEEVFINESKNRINWKFIDVMEVSLIKELKDGIELTSNIHEQEESHAFIRFVRQKSMVIQINSLQFS